MIEKTEETRHKWKIIDAEIDTLCAELVVDSGEVRMEFYGDYVDPLSDSVSISFDLDETVEFHKALGRAIAIAEAQE